MESNKNADNFNGYFIADIDFVLIWMIRIKKKNPYPKYSIVKMLIGGAIAMFIAAFVGFLVSLIITMVRVGPSIFIDVIKNALLGNLAPVQQYAQAETGFWQGFFRALIQAFILAALFEELAKYIVMRLCLKKPGALTNRLDAVICGAIVGLGFQIIEDLLYANGSIVSAIVRAVTPYHFIFGMIMGYFFGKALETGKKSDHVKSLLLPILVHGLFDVSAELTKVDDMFFLLFIAVAIGMIVLSIILLLKLKKWGKENPFPPIERA